MRFEVWICKYGMTFSYFFGSDTSERILDNEHFHGSVFASARPLELVAFQALLSRRNQLVKTMWTKQQLKEIKTLWDIDRHQYLVLIPSMDQDRNKVLWLFDRPWLRVEFILTLRLVVSDAIVPATNFKYRINIYKFSIHDQFRWQWSVLNQVCLHYGCVCLLWHLE